MFLAVFENIVITSRYFCKNVSILHDFVNKLDDNIKCYARNRLGAKNIESLI